jgi:hypothetical protein
MSAEATDRISSKRKVIRRVRLLKKDMVYDLPDKAFSFFLFVKVFIISPHVRLSLPLSSGAISYYEALYGSVF